MHNGRPSVFAAQQQPYQAHGDFGSNFHRLGYLSDTAEAPQIADELAAAHDR